MSAHRSEPESPYAWARLAAALLLMTIGSSGMYIVVVAPPQLQVEFGVARADASLPYTVTMVGFALGGVLMGRLSDRHGVVVPVLIGAVALGLGYIAGGLASSLWQFGLAQGLLVGFLGGSATFAPLVADTSFWFNRRRGIAVAICISGSYLAGAIWPPIVQHFIDAAGWRRTGARVGVVLMATVFGMALGGWMAGATFDLTGSYRAAFLNAIAWNLLTVTVAGWLLHRAQSRKILVQSTP